MKKEKPSYVVSQIEGRVRLRHPILASEERVKTVVAVLKKHKRVLDIRPGARSVLFMYEPSLKLSAVFKELENELPELAVEKGKKNLFGISPRRLESRILLGLLGFSSLLGFFERGKLHFLAGAVFLLLTARHVWVRREAL
ncbi:MAG: hypothetical protein IK079_05925 [Desulfovibrio sp.]|nr:hypothetical protein [Desulfovibrio sp.]